MITALTKEQKDRFPEFIKKWTDIGLCTKKTDRQKAEKACRDAYLIAGLKEPRMILWASSPLGLLITAKLIKEISMKGLKPYSELNLSSVSDSVRASVRASVWDSVWDSVLTSVSDSVWDSVWDSVLTSVSDSVWASVRDSVSDSVSDSVRASVWASVRASVRDSVRDSVSDSVRASVRDSVRDSLKEEWKELNSWGQHDAYWLGFYDYFRIVCNLENETNKLIPLSELSKETGWHLFYKNIAILCEKPIEININNRGQLHNFNGPAIRWSDGYELYRFNGIRIDKKEYLATNEITKDIILKEENADVRREIIKKIGIEKTIEFLGAKTIDTYQSPVGGLYELLSVNYDGIGERHFLKMYNDSIKAFHIEGVKPGINTVKDAICFRNGLTEFIEPKELT